MTITFLDRPGINSKALLMEYKVIKKSVYYYQAPFFYESYHKKYPSLNNIKSLHFPLFPKLDDIINSKKYLSSNKYTFCYFGQLQSFRNINEIFSIFEKKKIAVDVFSWQRPISSKYVNYHNVVTGDKYWKAIAESKYLLVFDNNAPYSHYMPSKLYEFIAFLKPIILFTKNDKSAALSFLKDYPYLFIVDLRNDDDDFINQLPSFFGRKTSKNDEELFTIYSKSFSSEKIAREIAKDILHSYNINSNFS